MGLSRRELLRLAAAATVAPALSSLVGCDDEAAEPTLPSYSWDGPLGPEDLFQHGIASGDPLPDAVILWSRVTQAGAAPVAVFWEIATDAEFTRRIAVGDAVAAPEADFTVKVDATGLSAGTTYFYRFWAQGRVSPVGRTRTAAAVDAERVRFGVCSCASLGLGFLHAYQALAEADVDVVLHLGDYIYEYGNEGGVIARTGYEPAHEIITLEDYRVRYAWYRSHSRLQAVHAAHPMICVWDDHETANDSWRDGADNHNEDEGEGPWADRRAAAAQAWREWLPVRVQAEPERIWRSFQYGSLIDLIMLDTRLWGREQKTIKEEIRLDPERTLLGEDQEDWLTEGLMSSTAQWRIIGQQVMLAPLTLNGIQLNNDQWDGYPAARERLLRQAQAAGNVVVLTGDIHSSWGCDLPIDRDAYDPETGVGSVAVEMVTPAVSSRTLPFLTPTIEGLIASNNPHLQFFDVTRRGYILLDVTAAQVQADWYLYDDIEPEVVPPPEHAAGLIVRSGEPRLIPADGPTQART